MAATLSMGLLVLTAGALRPDGGTRSHPAASAFSSRISILRGGSEGVREKAGESGAAVRGKDAANSEDETFTFQAEMSELMSLLINTFYSNKDIFLRELVSNAADAIDKARLGRTGPEPADSATADGSAGCVGALDSGAPDSDFAIRLRADCAANTLTIEDNGIGMDRRDLVQFLGTVASSGTKAFMRSADSKLRRAHDGAREGGDAADSEGAEASGAEESTTAGSATSPASALIGQFGVGFYSAFLVAQHVAVYSRMRGGPLLVWESDASGSFRVRQPAVAEVRARVGADSGLASGGCGTAVVLRLKAGEEAFLAEATLADLVRTHCAFISAPVRLWARRRRLPSDPPPADEAEEDGVWDWRPLNAQRPLWLREPGEVGEGEYATFFRALSGETVAMAASAPSRSGGLGGELGAHAAERLPVARIHFEIDTARPGVALPRRIARLHRQAGSPRLQLRVLLFVGPPRAPASRGARDARAARARGGVGVGGGVRLYVRRVYVCDVGPPPAGARAEAGRRGAGEAGSRGLVSHGGVHLPEWALGCVCGVLDSDTIELNVSRERLRGSHAVVAMLVGEIVVARLLALLESMSDSSSDNVSDGQSGAEACVSDGRSGAEAFDAFYGAYATQLKLGVLEDEGARGRLLALLRFPSTRTGAVPAAGDTAAAAAAAEAAAGGAGGDAASGGGAADAAGSARLGGAPDRPLLASEMTTLAAYVSRMPREQKAIYYLSGESLRAIRAMPALERVTSRGFEVRAARLRLSGSQRTTPVAACVPARESPVSPSPPAVTCQPAWCCWPASSSACARSLPVRPPPHPLPPSPVPPLPPCTRPQLRPGRCSCWPSRSTSTCSQR